MVVGAETRPAWAQLGNASSTSTPASVSRPVASATRVTEGPIVDGSLNDPMWQSATPLVGFVQAEPFEGQPGSESTEVRILYDDDAIYVGVVCYDRDPSLIVTTDTRRDAGLGSMDSFQMIFDTFHDQQNGFVFGTNVAGSQYDAQVRNEGETQSTTAGP